MIVAAGRISLRLTRVTSNSFLRSCGNRKIHTMQLSLQVFPFAVIVKISLSALTIVLSYLETNMLLMVIGNSFHHLITNITAMQHTAHLLSLFIRRGMKMLLNNEFSRES